MNYAFAQTLSVDEGIKIGTWHSILSASLPVQITLLILILLSVISWAIILTKKKHFQTVNSANESFWELFSKAKNLDDVFETLDEYSDSSIARVFKSGYLEITKTSKMLTQREDEVEPPLLFGIDNLERSLRKAIDTELSNLESRLTWLATTGSTGPFIGLFGTVWGIMGAFQKIGQTNVASLAVVAPGISEALIATAIGLAAAIPASIGYNFFITNIRKQELELNNFASDFLNIAKRNFFQEH